MSSSKALSLFLLTLGSPLVEGFTLHNPSSKRITTSVTTKCFGLLDEHQDQVEVEANVFSRRNLFSQAKTAAAVLSAGTFAELANSSPANAFENKISDKYDDRPKRRGPKPKDIGLGKRKDMVGEEYIGLKECGPAPNCFCSTDNIEDDPEHNIPAWTWPASYESNKEKAFNDLLEVVKAYKPGQGNIDGGGFQVVNFDPVKGYLYAQFESLKNGYIDDVEFAFIDGLGDGKVQVRSSSRVGYLDFAVNAKRLNYIAKGMREKGWDAVGVDYATHQDYVAQNRS